MKTKLILLMMVVWTISIFSTDSKLLVVPEEQRVLITTTQIRATGLGAVPSDMTGTPQGFVYARIAAISDAQRLLLETTKGVNLDARRTIRDGILEDARIESAVRSWCSGAYIVEEEYAHLGSIYLVTLGLDLLGKTGLIAILRDLDAYEHALGLGDAQIQTLWELRQGMVQFHGFGLISNQGTLGSAIVNARNAAIAHAQVGLLEIIQGTYLEAEVIVRNAMSASRIMQSIEGVLRGAEILSEELMVYPSSTELGLYKVLMGVPVSQEVGIMKAVINELGIPSHQRVAPKYTPQPSEQAAKTATAKAATTPVSFGLIIQASGMGFNHIALYSRILDENEDVVYSIDSLTVPDHPMHTAHSVPEAREILDVSETLVITPMKVKGADVVISLDDAKRIMEADQAQPFLGEGRVVVIVGG